MIDYLLLNPDGSVFQRGQCGSEEEIPAIEGLTSEIIEEGDSRRPPGAPEPTYSDYRRLSYPALGDQLDMIWHAMDDGLIPKIEPMYSEIKAVKEQYPKPE